MFAYLFWGVDMKKYDGVLQRVRAVEEKHGIKYAKTDGKLYISLKFIYSAIGVWTFFMNLFFVLGFLLMYSGTENFASVKNSIITVSVCTGVMVLGYVLNCFKLYLAGGILSVVPTVFLIPLFGGILKDSSGFLGFKLSFYWRHLGPLVAMVILMVWLTVIALRANIKTDRQYKKVTENLFSIYSVGEDAQDMSEEQWDEFLSTYTPSHIKKQNKKTTQPIEE